MATQSSGNESPDPTKADSLDRPGESASGHEFFRHQPIDTGRKTIRLVRIVSISEDGLVSCTIETRDLGDRPDFISVSYMWGPETPGQNIRVDGKPLYIRQNLWDFLHDVGGPCYGDSLFWIDQICIDQVNTSERNHQVRMMGEIYSSAKKVVAWLGKYEGGDDRTLIAAMISLRLDPNALWTRYGNSRYLEPIFKLFTNPYWGRVWIVQELLLSVKAEFWYGTKLFDIDDLYALLLATQRGDYILERAKFEIPVALEAIVVRCRNSGNDVGLQPLVAALYLYGKSLCADPRDRVYALVEVVRAEDRIRIDYDLKPNEVFYRVMAVIGPCLEELSQNKAHPDRIWFNRIISDQDPLDVIFLTLVCLALHLEVPLLEVSGVIQKYWPSASVGIALKKDM